MSSGPDAGDTARLEEIRSAGSLSGLVAITDADSPHDAYLAVKPEWYDLRDRELPAFDGDGLPGAGVTVDGRDFRVHGITHADTAEERAFLRDHVSRFLERGHAVYCEQGIRSMYVSDFPEACAMDDYRWAMQRCRELDAGSRVDDLSGPEFDGIGEEVDSVAARFREAAFSLIESGSDVYGEAFTAALGDVASAFLVSHEELATGADFEAFTTTRRAATDPSKLGELQRYYERAFLPQPLEREWLRRHDRELEIVTHARNGRMADYAVYHAEAAGTVHLIVGAAHGPGVRYYLERHRDGDRRLDGFEPFG